MIKSVAPLWCLLLLCGVVALHAQRPPAPVSPWADVVEPDFPFFSAVLDARALGAGWPSDNLTPRGLILNLGSGAWACFDTDLLRVAAIWTGTGVTPVGMAQGSYHRAGDKAPEGQGKLPAIVGTPWLASGLYPGWQVSDSIVRVDPRRPGPDPRELGRGPVDRDLGRFTAVRIINSGAVLEYVVRGIPIADQILAGSRDGRTVIERRIRLDRVTTPLWLVIGNGAQTSAESLNISIAASRGAAPSLVRQPDGTLAVRVGLSAAPVEFRIAMARGGASEVPHLETATPAGPAPVRWPQSVTTSGRLSRGREAFVLDRIAIPAANPWRRNVRFADVAFLENGRAALVTFDGDVWMASGLSGDLTGVVWRRFTSGLHEPLGIAQRRGEIFVFDRNGLWRLRDLDGNGEADRHELVSNVFGQTAETREFAMSLRVAPDGSFVIAKGGQVGTTVGQDNGTVLRISADGQTTTRLGYGLRQPFASVDPRSGRVVASDQQGNYIPSTPLHDVSDGAYYGFIPLTLPKEQYPAPIAEPLTWIPHAVNASAAGQVWLTGARMGPLNDALVLVGYFRPELLLVRLHDRATRLQAAVTSLTREFDFPPLAGAVNPADGQLYVTGFQIWGTEAKETSGFARYRYTGAPSVLPREVVAADTGVLVGFDEPIDLTKAAEISVERWNYQRTSAYGSPHFKLDGSKGQELMVPARASLSRDGKRVFISLSDMRPVMQMRVGWSLTTRGGEPFDANVYLTPHVLTRFDAAAEGFDGLNATLSLRGSAAAASSATVSEGQRVAARMGCVACHSTDGTVTGRVGPSWKGLFGSERTFTDKTRGIADAAYLRQSILEPAAKVSIGFDQSDAGMPSYAGILSDAEVDSLIVYIESLK